MNLPFVHDEMKLSEVQNHLKESGDFLLMLTEENGLLMSTNVDREVVEIPIKLSLTSENTPKFSLGRKSFSNLKSLCYNFCIQKTHIDVNGDQFRLKRPILRKNYINRFGFAKLVKYNGRSVFLRSLTDEFTISNTIEDDLEHLVTLKNKHIALILNYKVYDLGPATPPVVLTMSEAYDLSLSSYLRKQEDAFPMHQYTKWIYQVANGLGYLMSHGIYHRHLNPRTCLLNTRHHIKLSDFWTENDVEDEVLVRGQSAFDRSVLLRRTDWRYLPPETLKKNVFTSESVVWSFGNLIWHIFTHCAVKYRSKFKKLPDFVASGCEDENVYLPGSFAIEQLSCTDHQLHQQMEMFDGLRTQLPRAPDSFNRLIDDCLSPQMHERPSWSTVINIVCKEHRIYQIAFVPSALLRTLTH
ncbi:hypothetical protein M3Y94_01175500 [Aphelenchoides besseyi]|nr:hypothetical protein M3Y94_01175500 [Aphelenchoides besseyi]